jgi:hypothetical protein
MCVVSKHFYISQISKGSLCHAGARYVIAASQSMLVDAKASQKYENSRVFRRSIFARIEEGSRKATLMSLTVD